jgi:hypothetical protein
MTKYIPESAVRKAIRHAMDGEWTEEGATAHIMALATAAPQDERVDATSGPAPTDTDILHALVSCDDSARLIGGLISDDANAGEVRRCIVGVVRYALERFAAPQPATKPQRLNLKLQHFPKLRPIKIEDGDPSPEPEGLREAAAEVVKGTTALAPDRACVRVPRESWRRLRDALARPAAAEGVESHINAITSAVREDEGYAISWHANIAMAFQDEGGDHATANRAAARFMGQLFGVNTLPMVASDDGEGRADG